MILLVDAAQGIEAQTLANTFLALENDLEIVVALNKIDLPAAEPDLYASELEQVLGIKSDEILRVSAKTGEGVSELLDKVVEKVPCPEGDISAPLQALIFDSHYDQYRGVVSSIRVVNGKFQRGKDSLYATWLRSDSGRDRVRTPELDSVQSLGAGEVGFLIAGIKDVGEARSGETVTLSEEMAAVPLDGYREPKPMVFSGLYPMDGDDYPTLRDALEKLRLNDSSFTYEPETSSALGLVFDVDFLVFYIWRSLGSA